MTPTSAITSQMHVCLTVNGRVHHRLDSRLAVMTTLAECAPRARPRPRREPRVRRHASRRRPPTRRAGQRSDVSALPGMLRLDWSRQADLLPFYQADQTRMHIAEKCSVCGYQVRVICPFLLFTALLRSGPAARYCRHPALRRSQHATRGSRRVHNTPPQLGRAVQDQDGRAADDDHARRARASPSRGRLQHLPARAREDVYIDLLTDSGTSAMSDRQWAGMMLGDEAYAGQPELLPPRRRRPGATTATSTSSPRTRGAAPSTSCRRMLIKHGDVVPGNMYFTTTRLHQELAGGTFVDVIIDEAHDPASEHPFKGNVDLGEARAR